MTLIKIISGGQTGADQGALQAAKELGLATGGWIPKGYRTDEGPRPSFAQEYGMIEHSSEQYPPRTLSNVMASDATLIFGNSESPGCRLTRRYCQENKRLIYSVYWSYKRPEYREMNFLDFDNWLTRHSITVLNVAGNRERTNPGIGEATRRYLIEAITVLRTTQGA